MSEIVFLPVKPEMAEAILASRKRWEYRRVPPKTGAGARAIVYASQHQKEIVGEFEIAEILTLPVERLIQRTINETPNTAAQVRAYFAGREIGSALRVAHPQKYDRPISLARIREQVPDFAPPQNFRYLRADDLKSAPILALLPE
jgi:type I restriction enzyme S subunit